ncbi:hypothetical protein BGX28_002128 [Mortierella sp. GBA30]|nr:hypothetical protein BGX28_002128 [Mortierella sp. GBA30]
MDYSDEEAAIAEAIRLSLLEQQSSRARTSTTAIKTERELSPGPSSFLSSGNISPNVSNKNVDRMDYARMNPIEHEYDNEDDEEDDEDLKQALALSLATTTPASTSSTFTSVKTETKDETASSDTIGSINASTASSLFGLSRAEMERERQERLKKRSISVGAFSTIEEGGNDAEGTKAKRRHIEQAYTPSSTSSSSSTIPRASGSNGASSPALSTSAFSSAFSSASVSKASTASASPASTVSSLSSSRTSSASGPQSTSTSSSSSSATSSQSAARQKSESAYLDPHAYSPQYTTATFRNTYIQGTVPGKWTVRFQDLVNKNFLVKAVLTTFQLEETWLEKYLPRSIPQCLVTHWDKEKGEHPGFLTDGKVTYFHPPLNGFGTFHPKLMLLFYPTFCRIVVSSANLVSHDWDQLVNTVYVQDFPLLSAPVQSPEELGEFGATLYNYLKVMTLPEKILSVLRCVDLRSAKVLLVPGVQGSFPIAGEYTYGIAQLARVLQPRCAKDQEWEMEYQTSSLGKLSLRFLAEMYRASKGLQPRARSKLDDMDKMPPIKVVFPTERHVQTSRLGELGAGTVCFQEQSANFTESAWGTVTVKKATKASATAAATAAATRPGPAGTGLHVTMRNWELGIVYVIETEDEMQAMTHGLGTREGDQSFFGPLPVPYKRPLKPYDTLDRPWIR